jgi:hypothetical protein
MNDAYGTASCSLKLWEEDSTTPALVAEDKRLAQALPASLTDSAGPQLACRLREFDATKILRTQVAIIGTR